MSGGVSDSSSLDMATALELPLGAENEAKFQALKTLQLKKVKQLMASLDLKDKEIAKLKITTKDNRRTQMIQALRNKIKDLELINDVTKEELSRKGEMSLEQVNEYIMKKTLGGPKRFRPLTREELENKIFELEKKLNRKTTTAPSLDNSNNIAESKRADEDNTAQAKGSSRTVANRYDAEKQSEMSSLVDAAALLEELQRLRTEVRARDAVADKQREEIARLRSRNAELVAAQEEVSYLEQEVEGLTDKNALLTKSMQDINRQLAEALEIAARYKSEASMISEHDRMAAEGLQAECDKLLKHNATLLQNLAEAEATLQKYVEERGKSKEISDLAESSSASKENKIKGLEIKLQKTEEKAKLLEAKCAALETEVAQIPSLKNQLRDKNIQIKEMQRNQQERERIASLKAGGKAEGDAGRVPEEKGGERLAADTKDEK
eukprot:gene30624-37000_t